MKVLNEKYLICLKFFSFQKKDIQNEIVSKKLCTKTMGVASFIRSFV